MSIDNLFLHNRTCHSFADKKVDTALLQEIYDISKYGATSFNCLPLRVVFVTSVEQKNILLECLMPGNLEQTKSAPVSAIFAYDSKFYEQLPSLFPPMPNVVNFFSGNENLAHETATRNSSLQAAYFMMVAKSKGLACGPMSGFYPEKIEEKFLADTNWKVNFLCNLGYRSEDAPPMQLLPRLEFGQACKFI